MSTDNQKDCTYPTISEQFAALVIEMEEKLRSSFQLLYAHPTQWGYYKNGHGDIGVKLTINIDGSYSLFYQWGTPYTFVSESQLSIISETARKIRALTHNVLPYEKPLGL